MAGETKYIFFARDGTDKVAYRTKLPLFLDVTWPLETDHREKHAWST